MVLDQQIQGVSMLKKITYSVIVSAFLCQPSFANKIVVVNAAKIMSLSKSGKALQALMMKEEEKASKPLQTEQESLQAVEKELIAAQQEIEKEAKALQEKASLLSNEAKEALAKKIEDLAMKFEDKKRSFERRGQKLQMDAQKLQQKLSERYQTEMQKLDKTVKDTVKDLAKTMNWSLVLLEESILYAAETVTDTVITALDEKFTKEEAAKKETAKK